MPAYTVTSQDMNITTASLHNEIYMGNKFSFDKVYWDFIYRLMHLKETLFCYVYLFVCSLFNMSLAQNM
jgi:hypothetical protein